MSEEENIDGGRIWSINAYQHHNMRVPADYPYDVYLNPVNMCWGWGTWRDRWKAVDFSMSDWPEKRFDQGFIARLNAAGRDKRQMIEDQLCGEPAGDCHKCD